MSREGCEGGEGKAFPPFLRSLRILRETTLTDWPRPVAQCAVRAYIRQRLKNREKERGVMKLRTLFVTTVVPACSILLVTGCDRNRTATGRPAPEVERTVGQKVDDKELGSRVKSALDSSAAYKFPDVKVNVYEGKVQLSGFVQTREQKANAENIAKATTTGVPVENKITVKE